ncbi:hypothetical protein FHS83_000927 [Rhizomicrobium palustre]|uniref:Uncharacterized protein n=1 Tax=Rhizomicrobium palustre TaxID=189966 RepID=A0A846MWK4_9PROT|nr:hypothetical protein [Rhizomicrobium palustre]
MAEERAGFKQLLHFEVKFLRTGRRMGQISGLFAKSVQ